VDYIIVDYIIEDYIIVDSIVVDYVYYSWLYYCWPHYCCKIWLECFLFKFGRSIENRAIDLLSINLFAMDFK
jgi:hypothetical protein